MKAFIPDSASTGNTKLANVPDIELACEDQVLIKVSTFSVNRGETFLLESPAEGWRPGKDVAGVVVANLDPQTGPSIGARVVAHPPAKGWAEYVAVDKESVCELPDSISDTDAAALPLAGITALRLAKRAGFAAGLKVFITGASGGVGHYLTQLLVHMGAEVSVLVRKNARGKELQKYGARVHTSIPADEKFDIVYESVGGSSFGEAIATLLPFGKLVWFGQASKEPVTINFFDFLTNNPEITIEHFSYAEEGAYTKDLESLIRLVASGNLVPYIGLVSDWEETGSVLEKLVNRGVSGNAVLQINSN